MYAKSASSCRLWDDRSAMAPATGSTTTCRMTDSDTAYAKTDPGATGMPSGCSILPRAVHGVADVDAAGRLSSAMEVR